MGIRISCNQMTGSQDRRAPEALVLRWNSSTLRVQCPYCLMSHGHGFASSDEDSVDDHSHVGWMLRMTRKLRRRRSDCHYAGGDYTFVFPQTIDSVGACYGWELDRKNTRFVTVNDQGVVAVPVDDAQDGRSLLPQFRTASQVTEEDTSDTDNLLSATHNLNLSGDEEGPSATSKTTDQVLDELYSDFQFRRNMYFSHCILNELHELEKLATLYQNDQLVGSIDEEGNTGCLFAATGEAGLDILRWLQDRGDSIHQPNHFGRTALMEAALWGRLETVQYLVQQNVDLKVRDGNEMEAAHLAANTKRNTKERFIRSGSVYREPPVAERNREVIQAFLVRLTPIQMNDAHPGQSPQRYAFFNRKSDGNLELYRPQILLEPPVALHGIQKQKAFATLDRGSCYPYINAMSGYSHPGWPNVLDNTEWTDRAEGLRRVLKLPQNRSAASHVEPQLLAYLVDRHSLHHFHDDDDDEAMEFRALASVMPQCNLQSVITVSKSDLCDACVPFVERFRAAFSEFDVAIHFVGESVTPLNIR